MTTNAYMTGRKKFARPQAMLWADNPGGESESGLYIPDGYEVGAIIEDGVDPALADQFIILSDHNRQPLDFKTNRIENRQRMINGRMRSYHVADKISVGVSWNMLPSRSYSSNPNFNAYGRTDLNGQSGLPGSVDSEFTIDGGAGGNDILNWYENHQGSFWVYMAYDKYTNFGDTDQTYSKLSQYNEVVEMFISSFDYNVVKRGRDNFDFWNISVILEEV